MKLTWIWLAFLAILLLCSYPSADEELMRKHEPFLFFHKEDVYKELFYPMDAEAYLSRCTLWLDQTLEDKREYDEGEVTLELLANLGRTRADSAELYLKFVEKFSSLDLLPLQPKVYYWDYTTDALIEYLNASSEYTYYYRQFIEPDYGYLVLQYWFLYAFNSWGAYSFGYNLHEGDWESITIFLHPVTQTPVYAAFSAHHDEGEKVRKTWDEIRKTGTHPRVFVALGSHANYFEPKFDILTEILTGELPESAGGPFFDRANSLGMILGPLKLEGATDWEEWENRVILEDETHSLSDWARLYDGKWGMDAITDITGFDGPRFPTFQSDSDKWYHPAKWAGIMEGPSTVEPPVSVAKIEIEDADTVWEAKLIRSEDLETLARSAQPRIIVEYADYNVNWSFVGSPELDAAAGTVLPRIIVEYADSCFSYGLDGSQNLKSIAEDVSPRVIIEYADTSLSRNLVRYTQGDVLQRTLSITSTEVQPGTSVTVHLKISESIGIAGADILINYDYSVVTVDEVKSTALLSGIIPIVNTDNPGQIRLSMAGTHGLPSGGGALIDIDLTIKTDAQYGTQTILIFDYASIYDESGSAIPVNLENGVVTIIGPAGIKGDVNSDGKVGSNDAVLVLRIVVGLIEPTNYQNWAADVNSDGSVAADDAILILNMAAGFAAPDRDIIAGIGGNIAVSLTEVYGVAGESILVPLEADSVSRLSGGYISITYDSSVLRAVDVSCDSDILLVKNVNESGTVRIVFAAADKLSDNTLAKIHFDVLTDDVSPLKFGVVDLYQPDASPIASIKSDGRFTSWAVPPKRSGLLQNFPNPFNPDTWIPYQLREDSEVTLRIFSVPGGLIRELELGYKPAGLYVNQGRAAYWNGTNEAGEQVSSGVYFYTIQAGEFTATRKMVVAK